MIAKYKKKLRDKQSSATALHVIGEMGSDDEKVGRYQTALEGDEQSEYSVMM